MGEPGKCPWCGGDPDPMVGGRKTDLSGYTIIEFRCRECSSWWSEGLHDDR